MRSLRKTKLQPLLRMKKWKMSMRMIRRQTKRMNLLKEMKSKKLRLMKSKKMNSI
jgi:hypothetical protein